MSEFKGTPGPWMVDEYGDVKECNGDFLIAGCRGVIDVGKDEHNANLIAMSPELLGALQLFAGEDIMAQLNGSEFEEPIDDEEWVKFRFIAKDFRKAAAVIAKALGESK